VSVLKLAIASPLRRTFDYLPPGGMTPEQVAALEPGARFRVPFGKREVTGYLLQVTDTSELDRDALKPAAALLDPKTLVEPRLMELGLWAAEYYQHPVGEVLCALFPRHLREGRAHREWGQAGWRLSTRGKGLPGGALARAPRQAQALELLQRHGAVSGAQLAEQGISSAVMTRLREHGLVEPCLLERPVAMPVPGPGHELTAEQAAVVSAIGGTAEGFTCHLLEGVTGSGKTEVYLQLIAACLAEGRQALVLIPEIGLTPQTLARFEERFGSGIAVLHSAMTDARRYAAWDSARCGRARIVIGTRSAIFTPLENPGIIIVDEEHDSSYKQQDGFRYSARDVAVKRGQICHCPVLLGSATPSLESIYNARSGRYRLQRLTRRAGDAALPTMTALDVRRQPLRGGLSPPLVEAIAQALAGGRQVLLFLNRRGYAPTLQCHDCGWIAECADCDARLTVHRRRRRLRCHHCGASRALPHTCPECFGENLLTAGLGTEQTEDYLRAEFTRWPVYRVDSDSMQGRHAMQDMVEEINRGEACILLGTQMLAKGHHFPAVGLVAVIDTDAMLFSPDFRGEERMAQLLTQVAGRAGRDRHIGRVLLQTHHPDHPLLRGLLTRHYPELARELLQHRIDAGLPPSGQLMLVRSDCSDADRGDAFLQQLRAAVTGSLPKGCHLIGPLPSPMQRRAGKFRSQLVVTAPGRGAGKVAAQILVRQAEQLPVRGDLKWFIDVDPSDVF
jgi:primosomal protein N' (replication factor Y)